MSHQDREQLKEIAQDLITQAIQAGKKETSGLVIELKKELLGAVKDEIKVTVNGKIDNIKNHLLDQDKRLDNIDKKIDRLKPVLEAITLTRIVKKFVVWVSPLIPIGGIAYAFVKWIR